MGIFETMLIIFIPAGTLLLNLWRKRFGSSARRFRVPYFLVSMAMAIGPLIYVRSVEPNHTALGVVLAGVAFFWFSIVGARSANA